MINRNNFKSFIDETVSPYAKKQSSADLRVDPYAHLEVYFHACSNSSQSDKAFADSEKIKSFGGGEEGLGGKFLSTHSGFENDLHRFIKNINDVEMSINAKSLDLPGVSYAIHRMIPMNNPNTITMLWLNTKTPFIENIMVPWMQENTIKCAFPLIKADLQIKFPLIKGANGDISYWYYGIRPIEIALHKMSNEPQTDFYRKVTFDFDYFWVAS